MRPFNEYKTIIFDCDGVVLDSNSLKIEAMKQALLSNDISEEVTQRCVTFFAENFGRSRFFHVDVFCEQFITEEPVEKQALKAQLLESYSSQCKELYMNAALTPGIEKLLKTSLAEKYIASGSEQDELNLIFEKRGLSRYFSKILGSPRKKTDLVADILECCKEGPALMIGDAKSDFEAAKDNNIDFIYYSPFSNVDALMKELAKQNDFRVIESFNEIGIEV